MSLFHEPDLLGRRAGERALGVAEELRLDQIFRKGGAVDLDPRPIGPAAPLVERVRDQLLAGAALTDDQHARVRVGDGRHRFEHALDRRRAAEDLAVGHLLHEAAAQVRVLGDELPMLDRAFHEPDDLVGVERFFEHVEGAGVLGGFHRLAYRAVRRDHQHFEQRVPRTELARQRQAVAIGESQVDDRPVHLALRNGGERRLDAAGNPHRVPLALERHPEPVRDAGLVVDDEDGAAALHDGEASLVTARSPRPREAAARSEARSAHAFPHPARS